MSHRLVDNETSSTCLATSTFHLRAPGPVFCLFTIQGRCDQGVTGLPLSSLSSPAHGTRHVARVPTCQAARPVPGNVSEVWNQKGVEP